MPMNVKLTWKKISLVLLALFLTLQPLWAGAEQAKASIVSMRPTGRGAANGADMQVTAQTTEDSVVAQVFVNMINQALERSQEEGQEEWEDPSLAQYPLDPHELWEYGPSPRIRFLADEEDIRRVTAALEAGELKEEDAENINYLVYRESILLIGREEAGQYTVVYGKDKRSATLTPALPLEALEGKTGIVLLGENVIQDQVLMLEGAPALRDGALALSLAERTELRLNQLFSDGQFSLKPVEEPRSALGQVDSDSMIASAAPLQGAPTRGLLEKSVSGTNWSGKVYDYAPDWDNCDIGLDVDVWKLRFNMAVTLAVKAKFDITTTGASRGREKVEVANINIDLKYGFSLNLKYEFVAQFDDTPVHVAGEMGSKITLSFGLSPASLRNFETPVTFTTFEVGRNGQYFADAAYANKDINLYIGAQFTGSVYFLYFNIDLWFYEITIGPLIALNLEFKSGVDVKARWEKDTLDQDTFNRASHHSVHSCVGRGETGCLSFITKETGTWGVSIKIDLYFKSWYFNPYTSDPRDLGTKTFYHSLTHHSGIKSGTCPYLYYRVPVYVWADDAHTMPLRNYSVTASGVTADNWTSQITDANGRAYIFLPFQANYRYLMIAQGPVGASAQMRGEKRQETLMRAGDNPRVDIVVKSDAKVKITITKQWEIDLDQMDKPQATYFDLEKYVYGTGWVKESEFVLKDQMNGTITYENMDKYAINTLGNVVPVSYRVREKKAASGGYLPDGTYYSYHVPAYMDRTGKLVPDHETCYLMENSVEDEGDEIKFIFKSTAVWYAKMHKRWLGVSKPDHVYLVLLSKPEADWVDTLDSTESKNIYDQLLPVEHVVDGTTVTLADLVNNKELKLHLPYLPTQRLAIVKVNEGNNWSGQLYVLKYNNGVPQEFVAAELDEAIIQETLRVRYGVLTSAIMIAPHDYLSIPGKGEAIYRTRELVASVINYKPQEGDPTGEHTIGGVKYWSTSGVYDRLPEYITLQVWEVRDDGTKAKVGEPFRLNNPHGAHSNDVERLMWPWTFTNAAIDPSKTYTVTEEMPSDFADKDKYFSRVFGLNLINLRAEGTSPKLRFVKVWDKSYRPYMNRWPYVDVDMWEGGYDPAGTLIEHVKLVEPGYEAIVPLPEGVTRSKMEAGEYTITEQVRSYNGSTLSSFIFNWSGPEVSVDGDRNPVYTYYLSNTVQYSMYFDLEKEWKMDANPQAASSRKPSEVHVQLYRDGEIIRDVVLNDGNHWKIDRYGDSSIPKVNPATGKPYRYEWREVPFDDSIAPGDQTKTEGFLSTVSTVKSLYGWQGVTFTNEWVDQQNPGYVTVQGEKKWDDDNNRWGKRPDQVTLHVYNSRFDLVGTVEAKASENWKWRMSALPRYEPDGETVMNYYVAEDQVEGYVPYYAVDYDTITQAWSNYDEATGKWTNFDETTNTWTCDVVNRLARAEVPIKKKIDGVVGETETFKFNVVAQPLALDWKEGAYGSQSAWQQGDSLPEDAATAPLPDNQLPLEIKGEGNGSFTFCFSDVGVYTYTIQEKEGTNPEYRYDTKKRLVSIVVSENGDDQHTLDVKIYDYTDLVESGSGTPKVINKDDEDAHLVFTNAVVKAVTVEKKWDIDLEGKDHPESIQVVIQEKKGDGNDEQWETVKLLTLEDEKTGDDGEKTGGWKQTVYLAKYRMKDGEKEEITYRARELEQENELFAQLQELINDYAGQIKETFDEWIGKLKTEGQSYFDNLPDAIKDAANEGFDKLAEKLDAKEDEVYQKLLEKMQFYSAEKRIVYDKDDKDKPNDGDDDNKKDETPSVVYKVPKYTSVLSGEVDEHDTKYHVTYEADGDEFTITNLAVTETDVTKRWIFLGDSGDDGEDEDGESNGDDEDEDKPDSAYVVLLFKLSSDVTDKAGDLGLDTSSVSKYLNIELPAMGFIPFKNLISGGMNPVSLISELVIGADIDIFGLFDGLTMSIAKVDKDCDWNAKFVTKKYTLGLPVEYKGAELGSEIIRQIIKYVTGADMFISYNPFENFISIPGKAYPSVKDWSLEDLDLTELIEAGGKLTQGDLDAQGIVDLFTADYKLWSNVFNVQIHIKPDDPDDSQPIEGVKTWQDDQEDNRPDWIKIHVWERAKDSQDEYQETDGSPVTLEKSHFRGENKWPWDLDGMTKDSEKEYKVTEDFPDSYEYKDNYLVQIDGLDIYNTWKDVPQVEVAGRKVWKDDDNRDGIRPEEITIQLLADGQPIKNENGEEIHIVKTSAAGDWKFVFVNLPKYKESGDGQDQQKTEIQYTIKEVEVEGYETEISDDYVITNTHETEKTQVSGKKTWDDEDDQDGIRPASITVKLLKGEEEIASKTVTQEDGWEYTFADLPKYENGQEINYGQDYTVEEEDVSGYETEVDGFDITNKHVPDTVEVTGTKTWEDGDNQDGKRPDSITVYLVENGTRTDKSQTVGAADDWKYSFPNLPARMEHGTAITYSVEEETVDGYTASYDPVSAQAEEDQNTIELNITNTHTPETIQVAGEKTWDDEDDQDGIRPASITVKLLKGEEEIASKTVTQEDGWEYTFTDLPKYEKGQEIQYTVEEEDVSGYETEVDGFDITNKHIPDTVEVTGTKTWEDGDNQDGKRPDSITVYLVENGTRTDKSQTVGAADDWKYSFPNLPARMEHGTAITYSVEEEAVDGYTASYDPVSAQAEEDQNTIELNITNTHTPETIQVAGEKTWVDEDDQDGIRPASITVKLLKGEEEIASKTVTQEDGWEYTFTDLPKYEKGQEIQYTVEEEDVSGYTQKVNGFNITNRHTPLTIEITGKKIWDDGDNQDGIRPEYVTVVLYKNGVREASKRVYEADGWAFRFPNLPQKAHHGEDVVYTVDETVVPDGYEKTIDGFNITNKHEPELTEVSGTKIWDDGDDRYGIRPEYVTVYLVKDGERTDQSRVVSENDDWAFSFEGLPRNEAGREIAYTVEEEAVEDYLSAVTEEGDIVNTPNAATYRVEWYFQKDGVYPAAPEQTQERSAIIGKTAQVTEEDRTTLRERYSLDETADNVFSGTVAEDGSMVLKVYFRPYYVITFDPNGGTLGGSTQPASTQHVYGEVITIREAPTRTDYIFRYWKGSQYQPKEQYTVRGDHTFVAQWKEENPYTFRFSFTKEWVGGGEDSIDWTFYNPNGSVSARKFKKQVESKTKWSYEVWLEEDGDYYLIEKPVRGYAVKYVNVGKYADITDRCMNGGKIINHKIPRTGDAAHPAVWLAMAGLSLLGLGAAAWGRRKKRVNQNT